MSNAVRISNKKQMYPISEALDDYLQKYNRISQIPLVYEDLHRFSGAVNLYTDNDEDTLWLRVFYSDSDRQEIDTYLKQVYTILHSDGNEQIIEFLNIDAVDYCSFANSKPFRVKVRNILNDNFTYFYVKKADASRIYGLELEHLLSANRIHYLVKGDTLIEEHVIGIPGDIFIKDYLPDLSKSAKTKIAKEFVKFNEICQLRLLGDMRSYNYVIIPIHDFDHVEYRIRSIDFDQQSYEGKLKVYQPQFFKENYAIVKLVTDCLGLSSVLQYKKEQRAILAKRIINTQSRLPLLLETLSKDQISSKEKVDELKMELFHYTHHFKFKQCSSMGEILSTGFELVKRRFLSYTRDYY